MKSEFWKKTTSRRELWRRRWKEFGVFRSLHLAAVSKMDFLKLKIRYLQISDEKKNCKEKIQKHYKFLNLELTANFVRTIVLWLNPLSLSLHGNDSFQLSDTREIVMISIIYVLKYVCKICCKSVVGTNSVNSKWISLIWFTITLKDTFD